MFFSIIIIIISITLLTLKKACKSKTSRFLFTLLIACLALTTFQDLSSLTTNIDAKRLTNSQLSRQLSSLTKANSKLAKKNSHRLKKLQTKSSLLATIKSSSSTTTSSLANLSYSNKQVITIDNNDPHFTNSDLSLANGAWQYYGNLDTLNRATQADALLNVSLMPTSKREELTINPTGWHNKKIATGWLYNRCHLIGYQLTGQNNNWKNLITGTRSLNDPAMSTYENEIAHYLKTSSNHYVRYSVRPIFRGNELLARGVQIRAQSVADNTIHFNIYIFNIESGIKLNYQDGTSVVQ